MDFVEVQIPFISSFFFFNFWKAHIGSYLLSYLWLLQYGILLQKRNAMPLLTFPKVDLMCHKNTQDCRGLCKGARGQVWRRVRDMEGPWFPVVKQAKQLHVIQSFPLRVLSILTESWHYSLDPLFLKFLILPSTDPSTSSSPFSTLSHSCQGDKYSYSLCLTSRSFVWFSEALAVLCIWSA